MKGICYQSLSILLIFAMLLLLGACRADVVMGASIQGESYTGFPGVSIEMEEIDPDKGTVRIRWKNETDYEAMYGSSFDIQRLQDGKWVSCMTEGNWAFTAIGYSLQSGQEREQSHSVKEMFDLSKEGQYRFKTDCYVYLTEEESQSCELWAEFTLSTTK